MNHRRRVFDGVGPTGLRATVGASYYRNHHLSNFGEIAVTQDVPRGDENLFRFGVSLRDETRFDSPASSYVSQTVSMDWFGRQDGRALAVGGAFTHFDSDGDATRGRQASAHVRVTFDRPLFGAKIDGSTSVTVREMPGFSGGTGRTDTSLRTVLGLTFADQTFYGFEPRVEFTDNRVFSTVDAFDRNSFGVGATLVSRF